MVVQEARVTATERVDAEQATRNPGWKVAVSPCTVIVADGKSDGVAIGSMCHVGMKVSVNALAWSDKSQ